MLHLQYLPTLQLLIEYPENDFPVANAVITYTKHKNNTGECHFYRESSRLPGPSFSADAHGPHLKFKWEWEGSHPFHARAVTTESITGLGIFQALAFSGATKTALMEAANHSR